MRALKLSTPLGATRRAAATLLLAALLLPASLFTAPAHAQAPFPTRPIRLVVPFAPGGTTDLFARILGQRMAEGLGQQVIVENRGGAAGVVGSDAVAKAEPDGYTILLGAISSHAIAPSMNARMPYDPLRDFSYIGFVAGVPNILVVNKESIKAATVRDFIAEAKGKPGQFSFGSSGSGTTLHLSGELFKQVAGVEMTHVPYRGSAPAILDLLAGRIQVMFDNLPASIEQVRAGNVRAIAVTSSARAEAVPDVPTIAESGLPGFEALSWFALFAPPRTPPDIVARLAQELRRAQENPDLRRQFAQVGGEIRVMDGEQLRAFVQAETDKWAKVVKAAGVKAE